MKNLNTQAYSRARDYLRARARPLERALFEMHFESGTAEVVLAELGKFQNPDGGFGHALEPDMRTPTSSALCTEMALHMLAELHMPASHPMVQQVVRYLLDSFDENSKVWRVIPQDANDHPHAPWWHDDGEHPGAEGRSLAETFDDYLVIPRAGILAGLYTYSELLPDGWLRSVTVAAVNSIAQLAGNNFGGSADTLVYAARLAAAPDLDSKFKSQLVPILQKTADQMVTRDPEKWTGYCAPPLKLAPTPQAVTAPVLSDCLPVHLDYLIDTQIGAGYWDVTWHWAGTYPEVWPQAREEWRGILTIDTLRTLQAFGRL